MKKVFDLLKKSGLFMGILFIVPIIVIGVFTIKEYIFHDIDLSAGEWASLVGTLTSYLGTIFLGMLAFWQNDRLMKIEEKNAEIQEINLKLDNIPDFRVDKIIVSYIEKSTEKHVREELNLEKTCKMGYRETYQTAVIIDGGGSNIPFIVVDVILKNCSNADAHNVEAYESVLDKEFGKRIFTMGSYIHKVIEKEGELFLSYYIYFDDFVSRNGVKFVSFYFNLNYENRYHHCFYNKAEVSAGTGLIENEIEIKVSIGRQYNGKKELEEKIVNSNTYFPNYQESDFL